MDQLRKNYKKGVPTIIEIERILLLKIQKEMINGKTEQKAQRKG